MSDDGSQRTLSSVRLLHQWLVERDYAAFDPFDGLGAWVRPCFRGAVSRQVLQKSVRMAPINLRPLLGIAPARSTKAAGYFARAFLKLERCDPGCGYAQAALEALEWLLECASEGYSGLAWGNHFDYQGRLFYLPKGQPTVVWTALIGHAFVDAWESLRERRWLDAARSVAAFVLNDLEQRELGDGVCISYTPLGFSAVHNANMLAAGFLARLAMHAPDELALSVARRAVDYTVGCQRTDGSWWYGEANNLHWVDNFHTGYVLDSLWWYMLGSNDLRHADALVRGADFFVDSFFAADGFPKYYPHRRWPGDIQCAAQGIESLVLLSESIDARLLPMAARVAEWTTTNMQAPEGYFYYQRWPRVVNRTPMLHWGQATMLHALSCLALQEGGIA